MDNATEEAFDRLARLAARVLHSRRALISFVDADRNFFERGFRLPKSGEGDGRTPLCHSFCRLIVRSGEILALEDVREHPFVAENPAPPPEGFIAYLGVPLATSGGEIFGVLSVIDSAPRTWNAEETATLRDLAASVTREVECGSQVADHRRNEERLRLLESVVVHANDAILITEAEPIDLPGPRIVYVNEAFTRMTGHASADVLGKSPRVLQSPKTDRKQLDGIRKALSRWQPIRVELINNRKDGSEFWVELSIVPVMNSKGWYTHWVSIQRDVTNRKRIEKEFRESEAHMRAILDTALDCVISIDAKGAIIEFNPAAERTFGRKRSQVIGRDLNKLIVPERYRQGHADGIAHYLSTGVGPILDRRTEMSGLRADGAEFPVELSITAVQKEGAPFFTAYLRDITERKRTESDLQQARDAAESANLAKSVFLSRMSHELRTPLNAILGFGQLLELETLTDEQRENLGQISKGGRHLLNLINEVLDISRVEAGAVTPSIEEVHVGRLLDEVCALIAPLAAKAQVSIPAAEQQDCDHTVLADLQHLKQVLLNLLSNAVKYNHPGGTVFVSCVKQRPSILRINVTDSGSGIVADRMHRLFTPFDRLGAEQSDVEGTGLGLALCKRLIEAMNGVIGAVSKIGQGSTFWLELPLTENAPAIPDPPPHLLDGHTAVGDAVHGTVLYVEDNLSNLKLVEKILRRRPGVTLLSAMQGRVGFDLALQHSPGLIVLDLHLPDVRGDEVLRWLQGDAKTKAIPVVFLSADVSPHRSGRLINAGAQHFLTKPLDVQEFLRLVDEALERKGGDDE